MQNTVRTTIRIRKDLLDQSKLIALKEGTSMQQVINDSLARGFARLAPGNSRREILVEIDRIRAGVSMTSKDVQELIEDNKKELQDRADRILDNTKET